jgi:hypothetical protein
MMRHTELMRLIRTYGVVSEEFLAEQLGLTTSELAPYIRALEQSAVLIRQGPMLRCTMPRPTRVRWQARLADRLRRLAAWLDGGRLPWYSYSFVDAYGETPEYGTGIADRGRDGLQLEFTVDPGAEQCRIYRSTRY